MKLSPEDIARIDSAVALEAIRRLKGWVEKMPWSDPHDGGKWQMMLSGCATELSILADVLRLTDRRPR